MTSISSKEKFGVNRASYDMNDVNLESLKRALEKHNLLHPLGIKVGKIKIGKKQQIEVLDTKVFFYFNGICMFHREVQDLEDHWLGVKNGVFKNAYPSDH